jgi:hypothetical protein
MKQLGVMRLMMEMFGRENLVVESMEEEKKRLELEREGARPCHSQSLLS